MKKGFVVLGLVAAILIAQAQPVRAINKEWSAVAGFVGGMLFANAANCSSTYERQVVYQQPVQTRVVCQPLVRQSIVYEEPAQTGYWAWHTKRVYVPGRWVYEDTGCRTPRNVWHPAHYETRRYKVWVDTTCASAW